jgi:hypothetical protein
MRLLAITAGGEFHPALRTSAARMGDLRGIMTKAGRASKHLGYGESACPHDRRAEAGVPMAQFLTGKIND